MLKINKHILLIIAALGLLAITARGQTPAGQAQQANARTEPPTIRIPKVATPPSLEDYLNGEPDLPAAKVTDFRQREPRDGDPVSRETAAYFSYDDKNLYIVFVCKDDPAQVRAHLVKRENIFADDIVGIILDTFHDRQRGYEFLLNPLGIQLDGIATEGQDDDFSFDTLWHSEGRVTDDGYVVWVAIPFKSLRFPNAPTQKWGIAVARFIRRNNEEAFWPHISRRVQGFAHQLATLEGLENISPGRNIQLIPYATGARSRFLDTNAPAFRTDSDLRAGLDAKIVLKDALTLDLTINPDFSQVESDEPQVTINQRFEVFFPEKRPFFLENAGIFSTPENLFFSRRIADPQFGARLTGKLGRWAIGGLVMDDRAPGRRFAGDNPFRDERAAVGVFRLKREFGSQSSAGVLVTSRDFASSSNRVASFDTRLKLNEHWVATAQAIASRTRGLDGSHLNGSAFYAGVNYNDRHFNYSGTYTDRSPGFRSELGFIPRTDIRLTEHFAGYRWRPEKSLIQSFGPSAFASINYDRRGRLQDWYAEVEFELELTNTTGFSLERAEFYELFNDRGFRGDSTEVSFETSMVKWLSIDLNYERGSRINFFPGAGIDPFLARSVAGELSIALRPSSQLSIEQAYIYSRLRTPDRTTAQSVPAAVSIFNNHLARTKINYQFTRELSLRAILDYDALLANESLIDAEREKFFNMDFLLTYLVNPGTAVYVGYTDGFENIALSRALPASLRRTSSPTTSTGRQFFVKVSYLLRF